MPHNDNIIKILRECECINQTQLQAALAHHEKTDPEKRLEETLVELGFITESDLLACLSGFFRVHHITSHKLSTVSISQGVIDLIPFEFAEKHTVLPLFCYDKAKILAVVIADCQDRQFLKQIKKVSGYAALEPYLALGSVTKAAIAKHYRNDHTAFDRLKTFLKPPLPGAIASFPPQDRHEIHAENAGFSFSPVERRGLSVPADQRSPSAVEKHRARRQADNVAAHSLMSENTFIEVLNIVISTLEKHKDHSASVAKLVKELSGNLGSKPKETYCNVLAAYLHDCCMSSPQHLALLLFNSKDGGPLLRKYAQSSHRLFEKANLPEDVYTTLSHTFERYDGKGLPDGLKGKEIPQGSRIIAVVDAYMHLLTFEKNGSKGNPYKESLATIKPLGNTYFDPEVVDTLEDVIIDRLVDENSPRILIIDNAFQEIEPLVKELKKNGIKSYVSPNTDEAGYILQRSSIALIVSALNTCPLDGLSFYNSIEPEEQFKSIPFLLVSENDDQATVQKALDEGVTDVVKRPYDVEELVAKVKNRIHQTAQNREDAAANDIDRKGLSGNLDEIQLVDLIQMFLRGRKTGVVILSKEKEQGEIFFDKGQVTEARYKGLDGVEAFNLLIRWQNGFFVFYPEIALPEPKIKVETDKLLMEAYWIWDEEKVTTSELRP